MSTQRRRADVRIRDRSAGLLEEIEDGFRFAYLPAYLGTPEASPVSLSLPLRPEPYHSRRLFAFFEGLLPEGWLLELTCAASKIDPDDRFGLLLHTGQDAAGVVSILPVEALRHD